MCCNRFLSRGLQVPHEHALSFRYLELALKKVPVRSFPPSTSHLCTFACARPDEPRAGTREKSLQRWHRPTKRGFIASHPRAARHGWCGGRHGHDFALHRRSERRASAAADDKTTSTSPRDCAARGRDTTCCRPHRLSLRCTATRRLNVRVSAARASPIRATSDPCTTK